MQDFELIKGESVLKAYTYFTKREMPIAKGLASLSEEDISRTGVQKKKADKFQLEMMRVFLMLTMINHYNSRAKW